jgi:hypothetical protein
MSPLDANTFHRSRANRNRMTNAAVFFMMVLVRFRFLKWYVVVGMVAMYLYRQGGSTGVRQAAIFGGRACLGGR